MLISELRPALQECEARGGNVKLQLRPNCFQTIKLALATQEVLKRHTYFLTVQIFIKVEQVGLEQRRIGMLKKSWSTTEVDSARVQRTIVALKFSCIHPIGW
jgi:hypothetical protein